MNISSMTGYGKTRATFKDKDISIEIRSLNSKILDAKLKLPNSYRDKEIIIRKSISKKIQRGKIDLSLEVNSLSGADDFEFNADLFRQYFKKLSQVSDELNIDYSQFVQSIMRLPNIIAPSNRLSDPEEWMFVKNLIIVALDNLCNYRKDEGASICKDLTARIMNIKERNDSIEILDKDRIGKIKSRLYQSLASNLSPENIDKNRFEQEVIFYLEKLDINEEKVRLIQHCDYFLEQMSNDQLCKGRKLTFISQEMGREINTLGAKAYSAKIQRHVILMKEELEKIKEQLANVL